MPKTFAADDFDAIRAYLNKNKPQAVEGPVFKKGGQRHEITMNRLMTFTLIEDSTGAKFRIGSTGGNRFLMELDE